MIFFYSVLFAVVGILSAGISYFFLLLLLPLVPFLIYRQKTGKKILILLLSILVLFFFLVLCYPKTTGGSLSSYGIVMKSARNYYLLLTFRGKFYVSDKNHSLPLFSILSVQGERKPLSFSHYESGFDFKAYLRSQGVFSTLQVKKKEVLFTSPLHYDALKAYLSQHLSEEGKSFAFSFLFQESLFSQDSVGALKELGIMNLFSVSGFHFSYLFHLMRKLIGKKGKKYYDFFELILLLLFLFFSSFSYSMRRLFLLSLFRTISHHSKYRLDYLSRLSLSALILLFLEPYSLFSASFYYPFPLLFTLAILPCREERKKSSAFSFYLRLKAFYLPYTLRKDSSFSFLSFILSFLLIICSHFLFLFSFLLILIPQSGLLYSQLVKGLLWVLDRLVRVDFVFVSGKVGILFFVIYYVLFFLMEVLRFYSFPKQTKQVAALLCFLSSSTLIPDILPHQEVVFLDVDQGDATLIRSGRTNILIDTGGRTDVDLAKECLIPYFRKRKIASLDAVVITHEDYDHCGALVSLEELFSVKAVYRREDFLNRNNHLQIGEIEIENLNTYHYSSGVDNNLISGVYYTKIRSKKIMIMGDAPKEVEKKIMKDHPSLTADILKVGHHGSDTSCDEGFLKQMQPSLAIISCGERNRYGHPHKSTLQALENQNIPYRRTDEEGSIRIPL